MTEILTGREGFTAAIIDDPHQWEVSNDVQKWRRYVESTDENAEAVVGWISMPVLTLTHPSMLWRRIQKPRTPREYRCEAVEVQGTGLTPFVRINLPHGWEPGPAPVRVTVTELIDCAEPEPDWKARCEQAERELALVTSENRRLSEAIGVTSKTIAARKLHGAHLGRLTEMIETMQGELENA